MIFDIENAAEDTANTAIIPERSKSAYQATYHKFENWCKQKKVVTITEKAILAYFSQASKVWRASTLLNNYSMLRTTIYVKKNVDISKFSGVVAFLKKQSKGYRPKKSKIFTRQEVVRFMREAEDEKYLLMKVGRNMKSFFVTYRDVMSLVFRWF